MHVSKVTKRTIIVVFASAITVFAVLVFALFHGYFDHGLFEVKQSRWSPTNRVAMIAERSDHEALGGLDYFVLVGDHVFSPSELRHAYYGDVIIFSAESPCLTLNWKSPAQLEIDCEGDIVNVDHINLQKHQSGDIIVSYKNIATK
jgi:hypothetical protein